MTSLAKAGPVDGSPKIILECKEGQVPIASLRLDSRRTAAASTARGLLDQAIPSPVAEAFSLLAEIAIDRAKAGAMDLVKRKFVKPMCTEFTLATLNLPGSGLAFPTTCSLLDLLRLEDVLSSGRSLVAAARDDVRNTLAPALLDAVVTSDETRDLANIALKFANRMIDGESSAIVEIDLLTSLLDHLAWSSGFEKSEALVFSWLTSLNLQAKGLEEVTRAAVNHMLPGEFWNDPKALWVDIDACRRHYTSRKDWKVADGKLPNGYFLPPNREECVVALTTKLIALGLQSAVTQKWLSLADLFPGLRAHATSAQGFTTYLLATYNALDKKTDREKTDALLATLPEEAKPVVANACAIRLVVGIVKWCSSRESCSASDVADVLDNPIKAFKPTDQLPESVCWILETPATTTGSVTTPAKYKFRLPIISDKYIDLGVQLVGFLRPPAKGEETTRALAMVRWLFNVVRLVNSDSKLVEKLEQIFNHLIDKDYLRALTDTITLGTQVCSESKRCGDLRPSKKALELIGAVASYVQTYEETKGGTSDEARKARKKALESLMDSATDRSSRGGSWVYSIGSPVGFSTGLRVAPGDDKSYASTASAYDVDLGFQWRVPVSLSAQWLPPSDSCLGAHLGLWVADLGQFARTNASGATGEITWRDFLGFGVQAGALIGTSDHAAVLAIEAAWSPSLYTRDVSIADGTDGTTSDTHRVSGAFTLGITFAYYIPFFDLN